MSWYWGNKPPTSKPGYRLKDDGLLDPTPPSEKIQAMTQRNATKSPFFRLPPEIRRQIYILAGLGGNRLLIGYDTVDDFQQRCGTQNQHHYRSGLYYTTKLDPGIVTPEAKKRIMIRSEFCSRGRSLYPISGTAPNRIPIALLRVCRSIYSETCLTPYTYNTFSLLNHNITKQKWLEALKPIQRHSLRSLVQLWDLPLDLASQGLKHGLITLKFSAIFNWDHHIFYQEHYRRSREKAINTFREQGFSTHDDPPAWESAKDVAIGRMSRGWPAFPSPNRTKRKKEELEEAEDRKARRRRSNAPRPRQRHTPPPPRPAAASPPSSPVNAAGFKFLSSLPPPPIRPVVNMESAPAPACRFPTSAVRSEPHHL